MMPAPVFVDFPAGTFAADVYNAESEYVGGGFATFPDGRDTSTLLLR
jgi:hypothetical protein